MRSMLPARAVSARLLHTALLTLLGIATLAAPALASWPHDANNLGIAVGSFIHENPVVVSDGSGGAIITWQENRGGAALKDIAAQHVLASGIVDPLWPVSGRAICSAANQQQDPKLVSDGAGGAVIVWEDLRSGTSFDLYAQHVLATGVVDPAWPVDGRAISVAAGDQFTPVITTDGAGGAIIAWRDHRNGIDDDMFVQRITAAGNVVYAANGINLTPGLAGNQNNAAICSDGQGGALIAWVDGRTFATTQNDIYMQRINGGGGQYFAANGKAVSIDPQDQESPAIVPDQAGGFLITWSDKRLGANYDIYANRTNLTGDLVWTATGVAVCVAAGDQTLPAIVADGAGGAQIAWQDARAGGADAYAQHMLYSGIPDPTAPADGRVVCNAAGFQTFLSLVPDGAGGAVASWMDSRAPFATSDLYSAHVMVTGAIDPVWPVNGRATATAVNNQLYPTSCSDGAGGAIVTWEDSRASINSYDIYAQRVDRFGYLGSPEASINDVADVPNDQGDRVKLSWAASWLDQASDPNLNAYDLYRSVPPLAAAQRIATGASVSARPSAAAEGATRELLTTTSATAIYYWEYLATVNAQHFLPGYSALVATGGDSTGAINPKTLFMVVARNTSGSYYWLSAPDSGYSVDNLAPATPAPFTGNYGAGVTHLHWNPNVEPDLATYRVYRGASPSFVPGPASLVGAPSDTGFADIGAAGGYYKLSAIDVHGNESGFALLSPGGTLAVGGDATLRFALSGAQPNPSRGNRVTVEFVLGSASPAHLDLLDVCGRLVSTRDVGALGAGRHAIDLAAGRRLPAGLYLVRLTQGGEQRTARAVVVD